ncbi:MAG: zinc-binding dehydrogenase [Gammaproteobacteria bacterium]|nr:zinc-binding dehydrogenase [Gammaproteobacteria bacterium]
MKAAVFKGPGRGLVIEERPDPVPGPAEVVIRVGRVGICTSDLHMTSGHGYQYPAESVFGHEFAGEVVAVGPGVTEFQRGDRVAPLPFIGCGHCVACDAGRPQACAEVQNFVVAGYCQYSRVGVRDCVRLPAEVSDEEGALVEPLAVGLQGVRKAGLAPGARVLVMGAGPIGLACAYHARRLGAGRVAVLARSAQRAALATAVGADAFIASAEVADVTTAAGQALGGPPEVIFEAAGAPGSIGMAINLAAPGATIVVLGLATEPETFLPATAVFKELRLLFSLCYERADFQQVVAAIAAGDHRVRALITDTIPLASLPERFERLRGHHSDCKVLVAPWE